MALVYQNTCKNDCFQTCFWDTHLTCHCLDKQIVPPPNSHHWLSHCFCIRLKQTEKKMKKKMFQECFQRAFLLGFLTITCKCSLNVQNVQFLKRFNFFSLLLRKCQRKREGNVPFYHFFKHYGNVTFECSLKQEVVKFKNIFNQHLLLYHFKLLFIRCFVCKVYLS